MGAAARSGYFTKRLAEEWLRGVLEQARRGTLSGMVRTGATFADAAAEYCATSSTTGAESPRPCVVTLGDRKDRVGDDDVVFVGDTGGYLDGSALRRRYKEALTRASLRPLRFHEYADVRVMPMSLRRGCSERFSVLRCRHNQSASRKARSVSVGW